MRRFALALSLAALSGLAVAQDDAPADPVAGETRVDRETGLPHWRKIHEVFSHSRCANCHVEDERPRWSGAHYGATRIHAFNVQRGGDGSGFGNPGQRCMTCHMETNSPRPHGPPGAPHWHLAPAEMVWWEKSSAEICAQIKDPERNGGRTLAEVADHVREDALVRWGWQPGAGREPAPGSAEETYEAILAWQAAGAPCPDQ
ncbi:MAG: hypothetical protein K5872_21180 [Rhizobiaceae bacterium]|nr:hypothetical protein [Rhizobiaceae bacterium]MCV0408731.1 hypothetical protein [Rhizobiaceae bacterium]